MFEEALPTRVLTGFSARWEEDAAVAAALVLRRRFDAQVELLHAVPSHALLRGSERTRELERAAERRARSLATEILARDGLEAGDGAELLVRTGPAAAALVERAREWPADLIVLGPHLRRGRVDFGGTTRTVLGKAPCHVWMQPGAPRPIERVLVPIDMSEHSLAALRLGLLWARALGASVTVLHAYVPPFFSYSREALELEAATSLDLIEAERRVDRQAFDQALAGIEWGGVEHRELWLEGAPAELVVEREDAGLIVMGTHGRTGLAATVLGSVAYDVMRRSAAPVLAVRSPRRSFLLGH